MQARLAVAALAALMMLPAHGPSAAGTQADSTLDLLVALNGGAPEQVAVTSFGPAGAQRTLLAWADFERLWRALSIHGAGDGDARGARPCGVEPLGWYCGPDAGSGAATADGPCDTFSAWVAHRAAPGASYTLRAAGSSPGPMFCGGFIVPWSWELVEMSAVLAPEVAATVLFEGCYAERWALGAPGYCPNSFPRALDGGPALGAFDTFLLHWRARGPGVALSFDLGSVVLDHFAGAPATLAGDVAHGCYDLPPGTRLEGAAFPCP